MIRPQPTRTVSSGWSLVVGRGLFIVVGRWSLVVGGWLLVVGRSLLVVRCWSFVVGR